MATQLEFKIRGLFPPGAAVGAVFVRGQHWPPVPGDEDDELRQACPDRQRLFRAGRACARRALAELGATAGPLPRLPDGQPAWPDGVAGSISHSGACCVAVVAWARVCGGLGLDVERVARMNDAVAARITTPDERAWLAQWPAAARRRGATLVFSAKEAAYKCLFPKLRRHLGFGDVSIQPQSDSIFQVFLAPDTAAQAGLDEPWQGRYFFDRGLVFSGIARPAAG